MVGFTEAIWDSFESDYKFVKSKRRWIQVFVVIQIPSYKYTKEQQQVAGVGRWPYLDFSQFGPVQKN